MDNRTKLLRLGAALSIIAVAIGVYIMRPAATTTSDDSSNLEVATDTPLPRLLDLGADKCVPCKMMAPILEEMKVEFAEVFVVEFVDVWKDPTAAEPFNLSVIPTQIFFSADGTELFRHEGFYGREDILAKWNELGLKLPKKDA